MEVAPGGACQKPAVGRAKHACRQFGFGDVGRFDFPALREPSQCDRKVRPTACRGRDIGGIVHPAIPSTTAFLQGMITCTEMVSVTYSRQPGVNPMIAPHRPVPAYLSKDAAILVEKSAWLPTLGHSVIAAAAANLHNHCVHGDVPLVESRGRRCSGPVITMRRLFSAMGAIRMQWIVLAPGASPASMASPLCWIPTRDGRLQPALGRS